MPEVPFSSACAFSNLLQATVHVVRFSVMEKAVNGNTWSRVWRVGSLETNNSNHIDRKAQICVNL